MTEVASQKGIRALINIGAGANIVVSVYAAILGILNILTFLSEPWFLLFYIFLPLPFLLQNVFTEMRKELEPETHRGIVWHQWVWVASFLGLAVSLGTGGWLYMSITEWLSRGKNLHFIDYLIIGFPITMFVGAAALFILLFRSVRT